MRTEAPTVSVAVYMAGDIDTAKRWLRREVYQRGLCVTIRPETFLYTGGEESGFSIGFVNYPRFPSSPGDTESRAIAIAEALVVECCQRTALVVGRVTTWITTEPPGARS